MTSLRIFWQTIRHAVFSRESFMIFAIASLFYLVFYALPYDNQIIVKIPTAIVDLDQSRSSQDLAQKFKSASSVRTVLETQDFLKAQKLFQSSKVDVIIVISNAEHIDIIGFQIVVHPFHLFRVQLHI